MQTYPVKSYSWTILTSTIFLKEVDKSALEHRGTGIPREIRAFFGIEHLVKGDRKEVKLKHKGIIYNAHFEMDSQDNTRSRLFWKADFAKILVHELPDWSTIYQNQTETTSDPPAIRFEKTDPFGAVYSVDFIIPRDIDSDIESEIAEEQQANPEGKVKYYYGKKYERNPENRKKAIAIHGTTCVVCGFEFEKFYGKRGRGFVEIHHTKPLSSLGEEQVINPETDLVPMCSNCHRMIHRRKDQVLSIEELSAIVGK